MTTIGRLLGAAQAARLAALRGELAVTSGASVTAADQPEVCRECGQPRPAPGAPPVGRSPVGVAMPVFRAAPEADGDAEAGR